MKALALIFNGFEEEEATAPFALMRRAGIDLTIASNTTMVKGSHNITFADITLLDSIDYRNYDLLLIPGGAHYRFLLADNLVHEIIKYYMNNNKKVAAICAAPTVIGSLGLLKNRHYTCFTAMNDDFGGIYTGNGVTVDGNLITAKSVAYSIDFAYTIIKELEGDEVLKEVQKRIYYEK